MKKSLLIGALMLGAASANALEIKITYADPEELGFNSIEPYTGDAFNASTLGEARRKALESFAQSFASQFPSAGTINWNVAMSDKYTIPQSNYDVVYYIPSEDDEPSPFLKQGRIYPEMLHSALTGGSGSVRFETTFPVDFDYDLGQIDSPDSLYQISIKEWLPAMGISIYNNAELGFFDMQSHRSNMLFDVYERENLSVSSLQKSYFFEMVNLMTAKNYAWEMGSSTMEYANQNVTGVIDGRYLPIVTKETFDIDVDPETGQKFLASDSQSEEDQFTIPVFLGDEVTFPENLPNLGLYAHLLCDLGWCHTSANEESGTVIDIAADMWVETNDPRANLPAYAKVSFENPNDFDLQDVVVKVSWDRDMEVPIYNDPNWKYHCDFDEESEVPSLDDPEQTEKHVLGFTCTYPEVFAGQTESIAFEIKAPEGDYEIQARAIVNGNYIDIDGSDNFDTESLSYRSKDSSGNTGGDTDTDSGSSSGGSTGFISIFLLGALALRRVFTKK